MPLLGEPLTGHGPLLTLGVVLELVNAFAVIGIAAALWPVLAQYTPSSAVGYAMARTMEAAACAMAAFIPTALWVAETRGVQASPLLLVVRDSITGYAIPILFGAGALMLYALLLRLRLVPAYIGLWGGIAALAVMCYPLVPAGPVTAALALPIILNEVYLGGYLILKGFLAPRTVNDTAALHHTPEGQSS